jgi:hypothetical protein
MNFSSLKEYFYKLYNSGMKHMLVPILVFLGLYYIFLSGIISPFLVQEEVVIALLIAYPVVVVVALTIVHLGIQRRLKANSNLVGLGNKLDFFYELTRTKMKAALWISMFIASGFLLTAHAWFSIYFSCVFLWFLFQWPSPRKASNQLKLRGDERKMVMTKGEAFRF